MNVWFDSDAMLFAQCGITRSKGNQDVSLNFPADLLLGVVDSVAGGSTLCTLLRLCWKTSVKLSSSNVGSVLDKTATKNEPAAEQY